MYLVPGGVPGLGGDVPGPGGCTWSWGVPGPGELYLVPGGVPGPEGGVPGPGGTWSWGVYLVPTWSQGGVPGQVLPPCEQNDKQV